MTRSANRRAIATWTTCALLTVPLLSACTDNAKPAAGDVGDGGNGRALSVSAGDTSCTVSAATAPSGNLNFTVTNAGSKVTEFYLLAGDGLRIIGEVENIGPGLSRNLVVTAAPGRYLTACKPGMVGDGIRAPFVVTSSGAELTPSGSDAALTKQANTLYAAYVQDQTEQLLAATTRFRNLYVAGHDAQARALYPVAREHWERIEPVAESFGDLDPRMDLRQADLEAGMTWTGWHRIEKDLWPARAHGYQPLSHAERLRFADDLLANTKQLFRRTRTITFTTDQISNGATSLLDEVAKSKVTGEEEYWSHTDLWDFQANVDGARVAFDNIRPVLKRKNPTLDRQINSQFVALQKLLDQHRRGKGFVFYNQLTPTQVKALSDAVNSLSEPLSQLTAAVV